jgi:hypothetical protein
LRNPPKSSVRSIVKTAVHRPKDLYSGSFFLIVGIATIALAREYEIGTATNMGAGYFPTLLAIILGLLGASLLFSAFRPAIAESTEAHSIEPLLLTVVGVVLFALLIERAGLIAAIFALVLCSCLRRLRTNPLEVLVVATVLAVFSALVFVYAFGMSMHLWPRR